jgi:tRNA-splicing ligase RtcB (3'-phosphate/5'-hydroxy nucleic acid ligase)
MPAGPHMNRAAWAHFPHEADVGVCGFGATPAEAFEQAALASTAVVTHAEIKLVTAGGLRSWTRESGRKVVDELAERGILIKSPSLRGVAEEAPGAYKDVTAVVAAAESAGLARRVARLRPLICIKG